MLYASLLAISLAMSQPAELPEFFITARQGAAYDRSQIRVLAVDPTPFSETVLTTISIPRAGAKLRGNTAWIQLRVDGYALGADSQFERRDEISNSRMGQTVHVVIDNHPYFAINGPSLDPFDEDGFYYDATYKFKIPFQLEEGVHTVQVFPARSYGESLKGETTYHASFFRLGDSKKYWGVDLMGPYLTYNEPSDQLYLKEGKPVLLDFYLNNCELTPDGFKVRLTIDGSSERILSSWQPYYIYGMTRGEHTVRLELIDGRHQRVPGSSNDVMRKIVIY